ncbi:16S rRNA (uracil(1498)-N(3))-methyltransferase [Psychrilyobacter sp.]|uniref:RsmE family RNA methyltransferase n=1 Tax=Psychrilyobacter sp. TaxID=2586924 RepID=UPI00301810BC
MISIFVEKENIKGNIVEINDKKDINHLKNSFRLNVGDEIRVVDGEKEYRCVILSLDKKEILGDIKEILDDNYSTSVKVDIALGLLKNDKMDLSIQKLTEIGINKIIPMKTKRTVVKVKEKKEKWVVVSTEALKQCQGVRKVEIAEPTKLKDINYDDYDLVFLPYEGANGNKITDYEGLDKLNKILYLIGPEGGFDDSEVEFLQRKGVKIISLGRRILRAETAAIVAGGIILNEIW